jgi:hypothetical protein
MLQETLHVHLKHDIKRVFSLSHVEDWFGHELVKLRNMLLSQKISFKGFLEVSVKQGTLCDQRVNSLLGNLP